MPASDNLFELIKSLSSSEKRYFKLYCGLQEGTTNYERLFSFVDSLGEYDEVSIYEEFEGESFLKSLHVTKNYLYNLILKSLRSYHSKKTNSIKLSNQLLNAKLLERKGLYGQLLEVLRRTKKMAIKYEAHNIALQIIKKEISIITSFEKKKMGEKILQLQAEYDKQLDILKTEHEYYRLYYQVFLKIRQRKVLNSQIQQELLTIKTRGILQDNNLAKSFHAKYLFHFIWASIHYFNKEYKIYYSELKKVIQCWRSNEHFIEEKPHIFKIHLSNYLNSCYRARKFNEFPALLKEIKSLPSQSFDDNAETFQNVVFLELLYALNTENYEKAINSIDYISEGLDTYKSKINKARELAIFYNISILFFMVDRFEEALHWVFKILNEKKNEHRKDLQRIAHLLQIIYHYELGNIKLLENLLKSVTRKLKRWEDLSEFEVLFFKYMNQLLDSVSKAELQLLAKVFIHELTDLKDKLGKSPLGLEEILNWLIRKEDR